MTKFIIINALMPSLHEDQKSAMNTKQDCDASLLAQEIEEQAYVNSEREQWRLKTKDSRPAFFRAMT